MKLNAQLKPNITDLITDAHFNRNSLNMVRWKICSSAGGDAMAKMERTWPGCASLSRHIQKTDLKMRFFHLDILILSDD